MLRPILLKMSESEKWKHRVSNWKITRSMVSRFISGNTLEEAIAVAKKLNSEGFLLTMDHLGEAILDPTEADKAAEEYKLLLKAIKNDSINSTVSIKPTQLGLSVDQEQTRERLLSVVRLSLELDGMVEIDMENHPYTDITLSIYKAAMAINQKVRVCLQSYLYRTPEDLEELIGLGGNIRLVKGAYKEPKELAIPKKRDVDRVFIEQMKTGMSARAREKGFYTAIASHDENAINVAIEYAKTHDVPLDSFEFQFLYGIKSNLAKDLVDRGYRVRLYLPYGSQWYPYFMRRLAERPANLMFMLRNTL